MRDFYDASDTDWTKLLNEFLRINRCRKGQKSVRNGTLVHRIEVAACKSANTRIHRTRRRVTVLSFVPAGKQELPLG